MSFPHHGERDEFAESELMKRFRDQRHGTAKREWPEGRVSGDDEGSLVFIVSADPETNLVKVDFGKLTDWIAMSPQQAVEIAQSLIKQARSISKEPLRITIN